MHRNCKWFENIAEGNWLTKCKPEYGYVSGDVNDLKEMQNTYTYCPKCSKEILFIEDKTQDS